MSPAPRLHLEEGVGIGEGTTRPSRIASFDTPAQYTHSSSLFLLICPVLPPLHERTQEKGKTQKSFRRNPAMSYNPYRILGGESGRLPSTSRFGLGTRPIVRARTTSA